MINCRLCNSKIKDLLYKKYGFNIVKCSSCGLVYTDFRPTKDFLKKYYSKNYFISDSKKLGYDDYEKEEESSRLTAKKRIKLIGLKSKGKVLDVGCAYGYFLSEMPDGWKKYGNEISKYAYSRALMINPNANIKNKTLSPKLFSTHKFDLITLWDVIEHLDKPVEDITLAFKKLKKGGKLAISTGDVDSLFSKIQKDKWHLYTPPQHLSFFSPTTTRKLLKSVGFRKVSILHPSAYYPVSYLVHKLASVYNINLPQPPVIKDLVLPVNLGDIMVVIATK